MNLFVREMKRNRVSFFLWLSILIAVNGLMLASFDSVAEMAKNTEAMLAQYPEKFVQAMNLDQLKMTNILHYYASRSFLLTIILGSIYGMILSSCILSKEESKKTIEFLLSKPINRTSIITAKLACTLIYVVLFNLLFSGSNYFLLMLFKTESFSIKAFLLLSLGTLLTHLIFTVIGLLISALSVKTKTNISLSLAVVFLTYFLSILVSLKEELVFFKYFTPFSFFNTEDLVIHTTIHLPYLVITGGIMLGCTLLAYQYYKKKTISI